MRYERYEDVPWYRRSWVNNLFILFALFGAFPLAIWTAFNLLTGQVYVKGYDSKGRIKTWGIINKVWAVIFALVWTSLIVVIGYHIAIDKKHNIDTREHGTLLDRKSMILWLAGACPNNFFQGNATSIGNNLQL